MEISYWQSRWAKDKTGWHMNTVYPVLPKVWPNITIKENGCVLVPLCGKSLDLQWFIRQGYHVVGVDASSKAHYRVMDRMDEPFTEDDSHGFHIYRSNSIELWEGDFFKVPVKEFPTPDLIYDKASIIALSAKKRSRYAQKIIDLSGPSTHILMQTFEYDQKEMNGPPFSVDEETVRRMFGTRFSLHVLHEQSKLKELNRFQRRGLSSYLTEKVYHLKPLNGK